MKFDQPAIEVLQRRSRFRQGTRELAASLSDSLDSLWTGGESAWNPRQHAAIGDLDSGKRKTVSWEEVSAHISAKLLTTSKGDSDGLCQRKRYRPRPGNPTVETPFFEGRAVPFQTLLTIWKRGNAGCSWSISRASAARRHRSAEEAKALSRSLRKMKNLGDEFLPGPTV